MYISFLNPYSKKILSGAIRVLEFIFAFHNQDITFQFENELLTQQLKLKSLIMKGEIYQTVSSTFSCIAGNNSQIVDFIIWSPLPFFC